MIEIPMGTTIGRIVEAWMELKAVVRQRLEEAGINAQRFHGAALVREANSKGILTDDEARSPRGLSTMRSLAVHGRADEITEARMQEFLVLADAMKTVLDVTKGNRR